jgi:antibiotic biosynthesis monooxygenase (ABM) superfamily enzyme
MIADLSLTYADLEPYGGGMFPSPDTAFRPRPWLAPVVTTLAAWLVAFLVVTILLTLFGDELGSLPLALRALVMSGVLAALMANLAMPVLSVAIARWFDGRPQMQASTPPGTPTNAGGLD